MEIENTTFFAVQVSVWGRLEMHKYSALLMEASAPSGADN